MKRELFTAFIGATLAHLFLSTELSEGVTNAKAKVHFHLVLFFGAIGLINGLAVRMVACGARGPVSNPSSSQLFILSSGIRW